MSNYDNLVDDVDDDSMEEIGFDMNASEDKIKIKMDDRFTKNKVKNQKKDSHRGRIMISMNDEEDSPSPSFDGFDVPSPDNNDNNNNNNNNENDDKNAQFIISTTNNNIIDNDNNELTNEIIKTKKKKKKKDKKKKKKKYKTENTSIDMVPLSSATNVLDTNKNESLIGENEKGIVNEKPPKKRKKKKKKKKKRYTRNDRIKAYVRSDLKWWLFIGTMLCLFIFSYSAVTVGIAEDLILFYRDYTDLICHYPTNEDSDGTQTNQKLIGNVLTHNKIQQLFTSSAGGCIIALFGILISLVLIFCRKRGKWMRESNGIKIIYCIIFIIGVLLLFVWNILLTMNVIDELNELLNGLSHCQDEKKAKDEAQMLLNEFEVLGVLILPMIFVIVCTAWYIKIKTTF